MPFIAMPLLEGESLDAFLKRGGTFTVAEILRVARETARGLLAAHKRNLIHRDIKPANLWLEVPDNRVKVLDFGLAKHLGTDRDLTRPGVPLGTPRYMSPEQARGQKVDHRSDLFSLGSVSYLLCTGKYAFDGEHVMAILAALVTDEPAPVRDLNPNVPEPLADLIHHLLTKDVTARVQSAQDVIDRVDAILAGPPVAPPPSPPRAGRSALERLQTGDVTLDELLALSADPLAGVPLWASSNEIWPIVKPAALKRADVRKAFRDLIADRAAELWDEAVKALRGNDHPSWTERWVTLRSVDPAKAKELLRELLANGSVAAELRTSTQTWPLVLVACSDVNLPPPAPARR